MIAHRDPPHYLKALATTTTPKRLMWLDCAAVTTKDRGMYVKRWNVGALGTTHYTSRKGERKDTSRVTIDPYELWSWVDEFCGGNRRVVMWAYDLALQLRVSQGLVYLPKLGWQLDRIVLEKTSGWATFKDDSRSLMMCDIRSWAPIEFANLAADVGFTDAGDRLFKAGDEYAGRVCMWRAGVLRDAVLQILNWIEGEDLGQFRPTGSGQSYGAFRRRFHHHPLLVHDDAARLQAERAAMWTGRCEAWRHGTLTNGPFIEYDMQTAYCHIAAEEAVPTVAAQHHKACTPHQLARWMERYSVLAKVTVTTDVPCVPTRIGQRTAWPVGEFRTWLWDPELLLALSYSKELKVHECYLYHRGPALQAFARWVLDSLDAQTQTYGPIPKRVLKHWSRCLVGRLGLRYRAWEPFARSPETDLKLWSYIDTIDQTITDVLHAGREMLILSDMQEALESLPQVPSWVMSECRRRLWEAMTNAGLRNILYVDTDSMITQHEDSKGWLVPARQLQEQGWHIKGEYTRLTIHGPRNLVTENTRKVAGLPLSARQVAPLEFTGQVMRSIKESMKAGELDCVTELPRRFVLDAPDLRRQHLPYGHTEPFRVSLPAQLED